MTKSSVEVPLRHLLDAARGAASAYESALHPSQIEQDARWLRQGADENDQNVRLLVPHIESLLQAKTATWLTALLEGGKAKVGRLFGKAELLGVLQSVEQALLTSLDEVLALRELPVELRSLCQDQRASATTRLGHLREKLASEADAKPRDGVSGHGEQGHPGDIINKPKAASSEHSDC